MNILFFKRFWFVFYGILFLVLGILLLFFLQLPGAQVKAYFLDIGQGDGIFIRTPSFHNILIDGGPSESLFLQELGSVLPFFDKRIDLLVLTHPHLDHLRGLLPVLERYQVDRVLFTGIQYESSYYVEFLRILAEKRIPFTLAEANKNFLIGSDIFLDILYPFEPLTGKSLNNINNSSIVFRFVYGESSILFSGDAEEDIEKEMIDAGTFLDADILKVGHHGSRTSSSMKYLELISPEIAVIQSGEGNSFEHPHKETLQRLNGVNVYRNDIHGTIEISLKKSGEFEAESERRQK